MAIIFSNIESEKSVCTKIYVDIVNADAANFLNKQDIVNVVNAVGLNPLGKKKPEINIQEIEDTLNNYKFLEYAECSLLNDNAFFIEVKQIVPVMRIISSDGSYYVNKDGKRIETDARYSVDVPVVHGEFDGEKLKYSDIMPLINYISKSEQIANYVTDLRVRDKNNIFIVPNIRGHLVNFGSVENIESKFQKIKRFYEKVIPVRGWWYYDTISVKWDYQVVATRRSKTVRKVEVYEDDIEEVDADINTMMVDDNVKADDEKNSGKAEASKDTTSVTSNNKPDKKQG